MNSEEEETTRRASPLAWLLAGTLVLVAAGLGVWTGAVIVDSLRDALDPAYHLSKLIAAEDARREAAERAPFVAAVVVLALAWVASLAVLHLVRVFSGVRRQAALDEAARRLALAGWIMPDPDTGHLPLHLGQLARDPRLAMYALDAGMTHNERLSLTEGPAPVLSSARSSSGPALLPALDEYPLLAASGEVKALTLGEVAANGWLSGGESFVGQDLATGGPIFRAREDAQPEAAIGMQGSGKTWLLVLRTLVNIFMRTERRIEPGALIVCDAHAAHETDSYTARIAPFTRLMLTRVAKTPAETAAAIDLAWQELKRRMAAGSGWSFSLTLVIDEIATLYTDPSFKRLLSVEEGGNGKTTRLGDRINSQLRELLTAGRKHDIAVILGAHRPTADVLGGNSALRNLITLIYACKMGISDAETLGLKGLVASRVTEQNPPVCTAVGITGQATQILVPTMDREAVGALASSGLGRFDEGAARARRDAFFAQGKVRWSILDADGGAPPDLRLNEVATEEWKAPAPATAPPHLVTTVEDLDSPTMARVERQTVRAGWDEIAALVEALRPVGDSSEGWVDGRLLGENVQRAVAYYLMERAVTTGRRWSMTGVITLLFRVDSGSEFKKYATMFTRWQEEWRAMADTDLLLPAQAEIREG